MVKETLKKVKPAAKKTTTRKTLKPVVKKEEKTVLTVDDNLKKLAASRLPANFVKEHDGVWDHTLWLGFLELIREKGYEPIDPDRVGLILEEAKAKYLAKKD